MTKYKLENGFIFNWKEGFSIQVLQGKNSCSIRANKEGLLSLANHLIALADENVPELYHFHLDESNSLENGSIELIVEKDNNLN